MNQALEQPRATSGEKPDAPAACFHCGLPCGHEGVTAGDRSFCCPGCRLVCELIEESGLGRFYELGEHPGIQVRAAAGREQWAFLDDEKLQRQLLDFSDGTLNRVTFHLPAIHCVACVWLLENLFRLHPGIGQSRVQFPKREVSITFSAARLKLSELVALLASIGYEPTLTLGALDRPKPSRARRRQWLQVGVAGFAFGNIMLLSLPNYLGLDSLSAPLFRAVFGYLSLLLALPVLVYSASDYWRSAFLSFRQRMLTLEVPIALGLLALYGQSAFEILSGRGEGYLDSLSGLVFFLLCGRVFQQKTHERLAFDRDFKSFFPLSVRRRRRLAEGRDTSLEFSMAPDVPTVLRTEVRVPRPVHGPDARPQLEVEAPHEPGRSGRQSGPSLPQRDPSRLTSAATVQGDNARVVSGNSFPGEEGERHPARDEGKAADLTACAGTISPSPGGEGRGEGEPASNSNPDDLWLEEQIALSDLRVGDRLLLRHRELIPADARLVRGSALIDYSFVTGESEPVAKHENDHLYAGGQQLGGAIEVETVKPVSQSYLASLWNHEAFQKPRGDDLNSLTNRYSRRFTTLVIAVAVGAALAWGLSGAGARGIKAFASVLIVACPCALALAAPFALGTAQRWLARIQAFVRNTLVLERMAQVDTIVFDKTGTLTAPQANSVTFYEAGSEMPDAGCQIPDAGCQIPDAGCRMPDAGCRMPDAGCRMPDAGCRMPDAGCRMPDAGCRMPDTGCRMPDAGCRMLDAGCQMPDAGCQIPDAGCRMPDTGCRMPDTGCRMPDAGCQMPDARCRMPDARCRMPDAGCRMPDAGCRMPDAGCRMPDAGCRMPDAGCRMPDAGCRMPDARYRKRPHSAFRIPHSAFRTPPSTSPIPHSAFRIPHSTSPIPHSAFRIPHSEARWVWSLARHSTHPHSVRLSGVLADGQPPSEVESFQETAGSGLEGVVEGHLLRLGSRAWLEQGGVSVPEMSLSPGSLVWLAIDGRCRGVFLLVNPLRPETSRLIQRLAARYELALLSGDNEQERERFQDLFGREAHLRFNQSPLDKLGFIHRLQQAGKVVMMVGDGLNDAGALRQSDVGVAVVERIGLFSPASDVILEAPQVTRLWEILRFARSAARVVRVCFGISALYNVVGIGIAAAGVLSPVICAVLMPVSSISVVLFACGAVTWAARRGGLLHHDAGRRQAADSFRDAVECVPTSLSSRRP